MSEFHRLYREWIAGKLEALDGSGAVHRYQPVLQTWGQFKSAFDSGEKDAQGLTLFRGWAIQIVSAPTSTVDRCTLVRSYRAELRYFASPHTGDEPAGGGEVVYVGRSELDVWDHIAAAQAALSTLTEVDRFAASLYSIEDAVIEPRVDYSAWGDNLAHVATLTITASERITRGE